MLNVHTWATSHINIWCGGQIILSSANHSNLIAKISAWGKTTISEKTMCDLSCQLHWELTSFFPLRMEPEIDCGPIAGGSPQDTSPVIDFKQTGSQGSRINFPPGILLENTKEKAGLFTCCVCRFFHHSSLCRARCLRAFSHLSSDFYASFWNAEWIIVVNRMSNKKTNNVSSIKEQGFFLTKRWFGLVSSHRRRTTRTHSHTMDALGHKCN